MHISVGIMKTVVAVILLALALSCNAHAFLRPRFPHRTMPPAAGGSFIYTVDDSIRKVNLRPMSPSR